jgi:alkylhydroperoxidase/carboxymuconolactone decarboxylase family protein YurZ
MSPEEGNRLPAPNAHSRITNRVITLLHREEEAMALKEFAGVYYEEVLDEKTRQLVAMAAMAAAGCTS